jgi:hypothetical protein
MKRIYARRRYTIEDLVAAAYKAAGQVTCNRVTAAIIVSRVLADWLARADRPDLLKELQAISF